MKKSVKPLLIAIVPLLILLCIHDYVWAREDGIIFGATGRKISLEAKEISLRAILEKLNTEKGIWYGGKASSLDRRISVKFDNLSLHEALQRLLVSKNYVCYFDNSTDPVGVHIFGDKSPSPPSHRKVEVTQERLDSAQRIPSEAPVRTGERVHSEISRDILGIE